MNKKSVLIACALLVAGGVSFAAAQQQRRVADDPRGETGRAGRLEASVGQHHGRLGRWLLHRHRAREFVRSLDVTEPQKEQARGVAKSLQPIVDDVRPQVRLLIGQARDLARNGNREAARELLRTELRPLLRDAIERARPLVEPLVQTLTPEQRARLEAAAKAHGREFDQERFTRRLSWMLAIRGARR